MKVFKEFYVGDVKWKLSFDTYKDCNSKFNKAYLRIFIDSNNELRLHIRSKNEWYIYVTSPTNYHSGADHLALAVDKSKEAKRLILKYITNS